MIRKATGYKPPAISVSYGRLNAIQLQRPAGEVAGLAILVSGADDRGGRAAALARELERRDIAVLPVDLDAWRPALDTDPGECIYLGSDIEGLAKEAQRLVESRHYLHPVVVGVGEGGTLAYAALADAPAATFAGAVSLEPSDALATAVPVCEGARATAVGARGFSYAEDAALPDRGVVIRAGDGPSDAQAASDTSGSHRLEVKEAATPEARLALAVDAVSDIAAADADAKALPVVDIPAKGKAERLAVFYSGDGGWRDIDKSVGEALAEQGVHVVGVDSLRYFWSVRKPERIASDLARIVHDADPSGKLPISLLGYSFGADTAPFAWPFLPAEIRDRIRFIGLLGTEKMTPFQVTIENWLGMGGDHEVAAAIAALPNEKVLCVYGGEETETACEDPRLAAVEKLKLDGGHHFDGDYDALSGQLLEAMKRRDQAS
ncbi:virulence factor family protein [Sinorhizobium sp. BG8]|nr:virulence factor family protein [Sinorhizobium sp. BG8]